MEITGEIPLEIVGIITLKSLGRIFEEFSGGIHYEIIEEILGEYTKQTP